MQRDGRERPSGPPRGPGRGEAAMQTWKDDVKAAAGTLAVVGIGTPLLAALCMPVLAPVVMAAVAAWALRADAR
jgi:hypothetical protein